jgi:hypothetical protein
VKPKVRCTQCGAKNTPAVACRICGARLPAVESATDAQSFEETIENERAAWREHEERSKAPEAAPPTDT